MNAFWQGDVWRVMCLMKATGNSPGIIRQWKSLVELWASRNAATLEGKAMLAWLPLWQVRPFYTTAELAPILPALAHTFGITQRIQPAHSPLRLSNELSFGNMPYLNMAHGDLQYFPNPATGQMEKYWIVERQKYWSNKYVRIDKFLGEF